MELIGQLKLKYDTEKVSDKFSKRNFVLATDLTTPYPNFLLIQLTQDKCNILDNFEIGDELKVQINLQGREWSSPQGVKYFNTISAWRIEKIGSSNNQNAQSNNSMNDNNQAPIFNSFTEDSENLPF